MFYVANIIIFSVFLELLRKPTLLVCYKLNRFHPLQVNQFDIHALLFGGYSRFITLDKIVFYGYWRPTFRQLIFVTFSFENFPFGNGLLLWYL